MRRGLDPQKDPISITYLALYFGKLGVVEDRCVYRTMVNFKTKVFDGAAIDAAPSRLALAIGFACRRMVSKGWKAGILGIYDPQKLFESFTDLPDYQETMGKITECKD